MADPPVLPVRGAALRAMTASSLRMELLHALMSAQPATVEELAAELGRAPRGLYHHLRPLLEAGLVRVAGERPTGRRPAAVYELAAGTLELDPRDRGTAALESRRRMARVLLRTAGNLHEAALDDPSTVLGGRRRELTLAHRVARLTPAGLARVNAKLRELFELLGDEHDPERGRPFVLTAHLAPDRPRRRDAAGLPGRGGRSGPAARRKKA